MDKIDRILKDLESKRVISEYGILTKFINGKRLHYCKIRLLHTSLSFNASINQMLNLEKLERELQLEAIHTLAMEWQIRNSDKNSILLKKLKASNVIDDFADDLSTIYKQPENQTFNYRYYIKKDNGIFNVNFYEFSSLRNLTFNDQRKQISSIQLNYVNAKLDRKKRECFLVKNGYDYDSDYGSYSKDLDGCSIHFYFNEPLQIQLSYGNSFSESSGKSMQEAFRNLFPKVKHPWHNELRNEYAFLFRKRIVNYLLQ